MRNFLLECLDRMAQCSVEDWEYKFNSIFRAMVFGTVVICTGAVITAFIIQQIAR